MSLGSLLNSKSEPINRLVEVMKEIRLDLGAQTLPQDETLHPDELFTKNAPANIHPNETISYSSD